MHKVRVIERDINAVNEAVRVVRNFVKHHCIRGGEDRLEPNEPPRLRSKVVETTLGKISAFSLWHRDEATRVKPVHLPDVWLTALHRFIRGDPAARLCGRHADIRVDGKVDCLREEPVWRL